MRKMSSFAAALGAAVIAVSFGATVRAADEPAAEAKPAEAAAPAPAGAAAAEAPAAAPAPAAAENPAAEAAAPAMPSIPPTAPVVVVNGKPIVKAEYDRALAAYMQQFKQMTGSMHGKVATANDTMKSEVLEQLVNRELLYQEAAKFPSEDQAKQVEEQLKGLQGRFPTAEAYQEALNAQGLTDESLKDLVGRQILVARYVETQIAPAAKVPDEEVKKFYDDNKDRFVTPEQVKASHLLIRYPEGAKPEDDTYKQAKAKAEELQKKAKAGDDFAKLCQESSEDPGSKDEGGDLGFFTKDRMVEPFAKAAFALKVNEVSDVVETKFGFHVIKLFERKDAVAHPFDEVKEDIAAYLNGQAVDKAVEKKIADLKAAAKIDVVAPHL